MTLFEPMTYTDADRAQWQELFTQQRATVAEHAYAAFGESLAALGLSPGHIPTCDEVNVILQRLTGWKVYPIPGSDYRSGTPGNYTNRGHNPVNRSSGHANGDMDGSKGY